MTKNNLLTSRTTWLWLLRSLIVVLVFWQSVQLIVRPMHADEAEHAHVTYRICRGDRPYIDFFEHHCPGLWYCLAPYYLLGGYGAGVLFWGRGLGVLSLFFVVFLSYSIGRRFAVPLAGELGILILLPFVIANKYLQVRPEMFMLPLALGGIYGAVRFLSQRKKDRWLVIGIALASASIFFSIRSAPVLIWQGLIFVVNFRKLRPICRLLAAVAVLIGPALLLTVGDGDDYYRWLYRFNLAITPAFSFRHNWSMLSDQYVLIIGFLASFFAFSRTDRVIGYFAGLTIGTVSMLAINSLSGNWSPPYGWAVGSVLAALMFGYWCAALYHHRKSAMKIFASVLLLVWLGFSLQALAEPPLALSPNGQKEIPNTSTLSRDIAEMDGFCRRYEGLGPSWIVWDFDVHYVATEDISYFWFYNFDIPATLERAKLAVPPPDWASDIRSQTPFVVSRSLLADTVPGPREDPEWWNWFEANYRLRRAPRGDYWYWRRDVKVKP